MARIGFGVLICGLGVVLGSDIVSAGYGLTGLFAGLALLALGISVMTKGFYGEDYD